MALLRRLAGAQSSAGNESTSGEEANLGAARRERSLDALYDRIRDNGFGPGDPTTGLVDAARDGLTALADGAETLTPFQEVALEAIVLSDGSRPSVLIRSDRVDPQDPALGDWQADVIGAPQLLSRIARGSGRVTLTDDVGAHAIGTAFAVGEGLVATNRHVLQAVAVYADGLWTFRDGLTVDFGVEHERPANPARIFAPAGVAFAGPSPIGDTVDPALLDLAVIRLAPNGSGSMPEPLPLSNDPSNIQTGGRLAVLGHPAEPALGEVADRVLFRLFRGAFGVKRFAPGLVSSTVGEVPGDIDPPRSFGHDASTLGGNSGSCIVALDGTWDVVGLHFGGRQQIENFAHAIALIRDSLE